MSLESYPRRQPPTLYPSDPDIGPSALDDNEMVTNLAVGIIVIVGSLCVAAVIAVGLVTILRYLA